MGVTAEVSQMYQAPLTHLMSQWYLVHLTHFSVDGDISLLCFLSSNPAEKLLWCEN